MNVREVFLTIWKGLLKHPAPNRYKGAYFWRLFSLGRIHEWDLLYEMWRAER